MFLFKKLLLVLFFLLIVILVIFYLEPPKSWAEASLFQILAFFLPLLLFLTFFINLFLSYLPKSFIIALGLMMILVFQSIRQLNWISLSTIFVITFAAVKLFPKVKYRGFRFNKETKIPKLSRTSTSFPRRRESN